MKDKVEDQNAIDFFLQKPFTLHDLKITLGKITNDFEFDSNLEN
jgi:hypothetical protein